MTTAELKAEVRNKLKTYDQAGLIDDISMTNHIAECVKEFGGNIMEDREVSIKVEKGRAKLPKGFWALRAAVKCNQVGYHEAEKTERHIQSRYSYLEWTEIRDYYNYIDGRPCLEDGDSKYITETLYFDIPKKAYTFYYNQPQLLNLVRHKYAIRCDNDCPNITTQGEYDISIDSRHNYLTTNFNEGHIWMWYRGIPLDENGDVLIPETSNDKLKNYIVYFCIVKILEDLILSEDDPNVMNKLSFFEGRKNEYYYATRAESVSEGIVGWSDRIKNNNRRKFHKYENLFRNL